MDEEDEMWNSSPLKQRVVKVSARARKLVRVEVVAKVAAVAVAPTPVAAAPTAPNESEDEEAMWLTPIEKNWAPKLPLPTEPTKNPWLKDRRIPRVTKGEKVAFVDEGHKYHLQDEDGAYEDFIISGSGLVNYWDAVTKVDPAHTDNPLAAATIIWKRSNDSRNNVQDGPERRCTGEMGCPNEGCEDGACLNLLVEEGPLVSEVREMLTRYLENFLDSKITKPTFIERTAMFDKSIRNKKSKDTSYTQHVRHAVFRLLEQFLLGERETLKVDERYEKEMVMILRYLCVMRDGCVIGEIFDHVSAISVTGCKLKDALMNEWFRLLKKGCVEVQVAVSAKELASVPRIIPSRFGTILHRHIEHALLKLPSLVPYVDPKERLPPDMALYSDDSVNLPEMREREDYVQTAAFLEYAKTANYTITAVEMRVGSLLYKICGSLDMLVRLPCGRYMICDHKRTPKGEKWDALAGKFHEREHLINSQYAFGDSYTGYAIQMAAYRKLLWLQHPEMEVVPWGHLHVFHPTQTKFYVVTVSLDTPMALSSVKQVKGIADRETPCTKPLTPITYIEAFFEKRLEHLQAHFGQI